MVLSIEKSDLSNGGVEKLKNTITPYRNGSSRVYIRYDNGEAIANLNLGEEWRLTINDELLDKLTESIGKDNIKIDYNINKFQ